MAINEWRDIQKARLSQDLSTEGDDSQRLKAHRMGMAQQQLGQNAAVQQAVINQQAMASSPQLQGAYGQHVQTIADETSGKVAAIGAESNRLSAELQAAERARIDASLKAMADQRTENIYKTVDTGMQLYDTNQETKQEELKLATAMAAGSDIRIKEDIVHTGESPSGIPMYEFNYIGDSRRYRGTMAQDLLDTHPQAVTIGSNGYYAVYYDQIDVPFEPITE